MKYLKMLGLAAVAAAALMAFAGAGTASADELCTEAAVGNMCPTGKLITKIEASLVGSAKLEDTSHNVLDTCTTGGVAITELTGANGNTTTTQSITGESTAADITWGTGATPCTITTDTTLGGHVDATEAAGGGTTITATAARVTVNVPVIGTCVYTANNLDLGSVLQGGNTLEINRTVTLLSGLCPSSSVWNAKYKVTNHTNVFYINN